MTYGQSEDEAHKKQLRREAEHDSEVALDRQRAQEKARLETHDRIARQDIDRLERESLSIERDIRAIELEGKQLDATIRVSKRSDVRSAERAVDENERDLRELETNLRTIHKKEAELSQEEREVERSIAVTKRKLGTTEQSMREADDMDDKARRAGSRLEDRAQEKSRLKRKLGELATKIEQLRRGISRR